MNKTKIIQDIIVNLVVISNNLEALAETLNASIVPEAAPENTETVKKETSKDKTPESKQPTLEEVRAVLAAKSQGGKQAEVKALIVKHGAKKLTDIDPACYEQLLKEAGDL